MDKSRSGLLCQIYGFAVGLVALAVLVIHQTLWCAIRILATLVRYLYRIGCGVTTTLLALISLTFEQVLHGARWTLSTLILRRQMFWIAVGFGIAASII